MKFKPSSSAGTENNVNDTRSPARRSQPQNFGEGEVVPKIPAEIFETLPAPAVSESKTSTRPAPFKIVMGLYLTVNLSSKVIEVLIEVVQKNAKQVFLSGKHRTVKPYNIHGSVFLLAMDMSTAMYANFSPEHLHSLLMVVIVIGKMLLHVWLNMKLLKTI
ncbi:hypothetical protein PR048_006472 [Dryococelus australis]|uniref:Uncharacterized protein n=1 Tax=Dryococelus australis TaxID=614101 RepID=A0ABQ9IC31_9NEOP|nr:hypothetical protein PR048_006472 [Dryococelus australis]